MRVIQCIKMESLCLCATFLAAAPLKPLVTRTKPSSQQAAPTNNSTSTPGMLNQNKTGLVNLYSYVLKKDL